MRTFKTKLFSRFARKAGLADAALRRAVADAERGLIDADLGGGVIKQRIARPGGGKSAGFRTIVAFRAATRAIFVYGFAKNERENIDRDDLADFQRLARVLLFYADAEVAKAIASGELIEVDDGEAIS
jgi:hypothetical protein